MKRMFQSATLKLTAWYLAILMTISITFSVVIYQLNYREVSNRLQELQLSLTDNVTIIIPKVSTEYGFGPGSPFFSESQKASSQMTLSLLYINIVVFIAGGLGSYFLARRTLRPIEESHEAQSRFTSDASHELRTPLAAMKAELEVTLRDPKLDLEESKEVLVSNLEEVNKLIKLSEMLLQLSRLEHNTLEKQNVDLVTEFEEILKRYPDAKKRFEVTTRKKATTFANEAAVTELMGILIDNAIKYSPAKSKIYVRIFEQRGLVGFEIKNSGTPIPDALLPKLFDRFFRADISRTEGSKNGYGLGLAIAKKIIDIHHGEITVQSNEDATTFTAYLPIIRKLQQTKLKN
jgi:signal transduction histidine kinase